MVWETKAILWGATVCATHKSARKTEVRVPSEQLSNRNSVSKIQIWETVCSQANSEETTSRKICKEKNFQRRTKKENIKMGKRPPKWGFGGIWRVV